MIPFVVGGNHYKEWAHMSAWVPNFSSISYQSSISRPSRKSNECMCICRRLWSHSVLNSYLRLPNSKELKINRRALYGIVWWTFMLLTSFLFRPFFDWDSNVLVVNLCNRECKSTFFSSSAAWKVEQLVARHFCRMFQSNLILWVHNFNTTAAEVQWTANSLLTFYITCQVLKLEFCILHQVVPVISRNRPLKGSTTTYCTWRQTFCRKF